MVGFSVDPAGKTVNVRAISGPEVLSHALQQEIRGWRFATPLPRDSEKNFLANYTFTILEPQEQLDDDVSEPTPGAHLVGGSVILPPSIAAVSGTVRSVNDRQSIDATPTSPAPGNVCRADADTHPPIGSEATDFAELTRIGFSETGITYRVRVYRSGKVEWRGVKGVLDLGERKGDVPLPNAEDLLQDAASADVWSTCGAKLTPFEQPLGPNDPTGNYVTVRIAGKQKTINLADYSTGSDEADKFAWYLDRVADTHQWRHGDAATEPLANMDEDLELPKNGVNALMRAVLRFHPKTGDQSFEPLKHLLAKGEPVNEADESGWTALMYAVALNSGNDEAAKLLLAAHADVRLASAHGDTALMAAALHGDLNGTLLKAGADINAHDADGVTALMLLAQSATAATLKQAVAAGANPAARDKAGRTAVDYLHACKSPMVPHQRHVGAAARPAPACPAPAEVREIETILKASH